MRIEGIDLTFLNLPLVKPEVWAWGARAAYTIGVVEVHTDAGISGVADLQAYPGPGVVAAVLDHMRPAIIGESALAPGRIVARIMNNQGWWPEYRLAAFVVSAVEMACWDIAGKHFQVPVSTLFGGALREQLPSMYYVQRQDSLEDMLAEAVDAVERGYRTVYYKVGLDEEADVELLAHTREALGLGPKLRIDANEAWSVGTAVRILRRLAPYGIEYVEQPTYMYDIDGLAHVRAASGVPVAANQASWGPYAILEIVKKGAADVIMTDPHQEGGLIATKRVLGLCEMASLPFVNHAFSATTTTLSAHLQLMSTSTACTLATQGHANFIAEDYVVDALDYSTGMLAVPSAPGLGVEIDRERMRRFNARFLEDGLVSVLPPAGPHDPVTAIPAL